MKKKAKTNDLVLDYVRHPIPSPVATEFRFKGLAVLAIQMPKIGTVVMGKDALSPSRCWSYPPGTSMKEAVSKAFKEMLDTALKQFEAKGKKA